MATRSGRIADVKVGGVVVAGQGTWTLSGFTREIIEEDSWDIDIKNKYFGVGDGGTITFSGLHDPVSAEQILLDSACLNSSEFTGGDLRFYVDAASYWTVDTGYTTLITKCLSIGMEKSAMGTVDFEAVVNGGHMVYI
jgi:hypothetical protein